MTYRQTLSRVLIVLSLGALAGCASGPTADDSAAFMLDDGPASAPARAPADAPVLVVRPVHTAGYLDQGGIVYRIAPYRVVIANDHRWAAPLTNQLTDTLYNVLGARLNHAAVVRTPGRDGAQYTLATRVERFYGSHDGEAHIAGEWQLEGPTGRTLRRGHFSRHVALPKDGYPALVASLSAGWQDVASAMAAPIAAALADNDNAAPMR